MTADIAKAKAVWQDLSYALRKVGAEHRRAPTPENWKALLAAANQWEIAAAAWSAAISENGDPVNQRAEFVTATTGELPRRRRPRKARNREDR